MDDRDMQGLMGQVAESVVSWRRDIHGTPETAFEEYRTAQIVCDTLAGLGLQVKSGVANTGVVGLLRGSGSGPTIVIRAEMDALPIAEQTGLPFASRVPGLMHACGHDGHVAIGLGTAMVLSQVRARFCGQVKFVFQPAEETLLGAQAMLEAGVLQCPDADAAVALHLWPGLSCGKVQLCRGTVMAGADRFIIRLRGPGGHAALPHESVDVINEVAVLIARLQSIVSREIDPCEPAVIGVGKINGGTVINSVPEEVSVCGTVRAVSSDVRAEIRRRIAGCLRGLSVTSGARYELDYSYCCPSLTNDAALSALAESAVRRVTGDTGLVCVQKPTMIAEDFAYFAQRIPTVMMLLGAGDGPDCSYPLHHSRFNFDETALEVGVKVMSQTALAFLGVCAP